MNLYLYIIAPVLIITALGVVTLRNPIHSGLCLVSNLIAVASLYAALSAHFLATAQIVVYAGAVVVLVLFVLMLINIKEESFNKRDRLITVVATIFGSVFLVGLLYFIVSWLNQLKTRAAESMNENIIGASHQTASSGSVELFGQELFTNYLLPFEISSVLLISALIGATMIATYKRKGSGMILPRAVRSPIKLL